MADHNYESALQEIKDNRERVRTTHDPDFIIQIAFAMLKLHGECDELAEGYLALAKQLRESPLNKDVVPVVMTRLRGAVLSASNTMETRLLAMQKCREAVNECFLAGFDQILSRTMRGHR